MSDNDNTSTTEALPRTYCDPTKSYIITGGRGGFGLELAQWLIERGAKHLILTSRSGIKTGYQIKKIEKFREQGISINVSSLDISDQKAAADLFEFAMSLGPLGGIFHLAMVRLYMVL